MARYTHARNTFQLGEVSPAALGRADLPAYRQMCEEIFNSLPRTTGGVARRMGTSRLTAASASANINDLSAARAVKMIPFPTTYAYSSEQFLILTTDYIKRYNVKNDDLDPVAQLSGASLYGYVNAWTIAAEAGFVAPGVEQWAQYGDLIIIVNGFFPPLVVFGTQAGGESYFMWTNGRLTPGLTLDTTNLHALLPFDPTNSLATTVTINTASVGTGRILTSSAALFTVDMNNSGGRYIRVHSGGTIGLARITTFTSSTQVTVEVLQAFPDTAAHATWAFSQWGGDRGWPRAVSFYKERTVFAGNYGFPDGIWCSQIGDLYEMSLVDPTATLVNSDAFNVRIGQNDTAYVNHLFPKENLFANTAKKECYLNPINTDLSIGALNTEVTNNSQYGASQFQPQPLQDALIYCGEPEKLRFKGGTVPVVGGRKILEISLNSQTKVNVVNNLSKNTPDITRDRCIGADAITTRPAFCRLAVTKRPDNIAWAMDTTGKLYSVTRDRTGEVTGWAHHSLGGAYASDEPQVLDIIDSEGTLFLAVARNVGGNSDTICYEKLNDEFVSPSLDNTAIYLDFSSAATSFTSNVAHGFAHFNGTEVSVVADGEYLGEFTPSAGDITLPAGTYTDVRAGFNFVSRIVLTALESNALFGTGLGAIKRTEEVTVLFERTVGATIGAAGREDIAEEIQFRQALDPADDPIPLFSGEKVIKVSADYETRQNIYIEQTKPFPMTVTCVILKGLLYD
jgi:hypothetical protein